jgi:hypothetical protein
MVRIFLFDRLDAGCTARLLLNMPNFWTKDVSTLCLSFKLKRGASERESHISPVEAVTAALEGMHFRSQLDIAPFAADSSLENPAIAGKKSKDE